MKFIQTTAALVLGTAGVLLATGNVLAVEAMAKSAVNVRTGPGTGFGIVDQLTAGEIVDITECAPSGWCFVEHDGPDGWVSASYLTAPEDEDEPEMDEGGGSNPDCSFGFAMGPGGPSLSINCGDAPPPAPPPPADDEDEEDPQACFYVGAAFNGQTFCMGVGTRNALNATFNNKISSVELFGGAKARLCDGPNLTGYCRNVNSDTSPLVPQINDKASSLIVYVGAPPAPEPEPVPDVPAMFSTGLIDLQQTWTANLDNGTTGGAAGADIWYQAVSAVEKYITPRNGALMAVGDGSGYAGCSTTDMTNDSIPLADIPPGTYVCVKTNQNRISQFRVNGFVGTTMKIGYGTWAD